MESFGNMNKHALFDKIRDLPNRLLIGKESRFSRCSTTPEANWLFDKALKEVEEMNVPYRIIKKIEWYEPLEGMEESG